ncbi:copper uptake system-associated protein [Alcaligenes faecalis]|uniref:copper uptake system-associated protein n=1 Tax=Alcaligenes faecalis TaxID=511 RepID=UPI001C834203|nr:copper uptake system-associated protein [Alcaligenes faecalis]MBX6966265.1 copper uptake system-associated protein [Providencia rettgeri]MBX7030701.1 copper uptake system-associated protein [Alcaligenes faecalis]
MKTASQHHRTFKVTLHGLFFAVALLVLFAMLTGVARAAPPEADRISHAMKAIWDSPEAPLVVEPIVIEGDYALAGWTQLTRGGRALLKSRHGEWSVHMCGGDGLNDVETLTMAGMSAEAAKRLVKNTSEAEAKLPAEVTAKFSTFGDNMVVDHNHHPD